MKNIRVAGSAAIIKDKKILLLKRSPDKSTFPNHWTFPSGGIEPEDNSVTETVIREVKEEIGLDFKPTKKFNFYDGTNNNTRYIALVHLGEWSGEFRVDKSESSEYQFFKYDEAIQLPLAFSYKEVLEDLYKEGLLG